MQPCKHGHVDGARHIPCPQCASEFAQDELAQARGVLQRLIDAEKHKQKHGEDEHYLKERRGVLVCALLIVRGIGYDVTPNDAFKRGSERSSETSRGTEG